MWGSLVIFRKQKGPARKKFGKHYTRPQTKTQISRSIRLFWIIQEFLKGKYLPEYRKKKKTAGVSNLQSFSRHLKRIAQCNTEHELKKHIVHETVICVINTDEQYETPTFLESYATNTPTVQMLCPQKNPCPYIFAKNITCLFFFLLRIGQDFSFFRKTVCRWWVRTIFCFMSDMLSVFQF